MITSSNKKGCRGASDSTYQDFAFEKWSVEVINGPAVVIGGFYCERR